MLRAAYARRCAGVVARGEACVAALAFGACRTTHVRAVPRTAHEAHAPSTASTYDQPRLTRGFASASRAPGKRRSSPPVESSDAAVTSFSSLPSGLVAALDMQGIHTPTPIQAASMPVLLSGRNALLASHTGSGKTLAYLLPLIANLERDEAAGVRTRLGRPRAVIVVPNRELAVQILSVSKSLAGATAGRFRSLASTGFIPLRKLARALESPVDLLIVTPGRLEFLLSSNRIFLTDLKYVVLDETDTLLSAEQGFREGIEQTLLSGMKHRFDEAERLQREEKATRLREAATENRARQQASMGQSEGQATEFVAAAPASPTAALPQLIFCSASITPTIESYVQRWFPSVVRVHTSSLHHLPLDLVLRNELVGTDDKREVLLRVLEKESAAYRQRLMHNRTRDQNRREIEAYGGDERAWFADIVRRDAESRSNLAAPSSAADLHIRNQLRYDEESQDHIHTATEIAPVKEAELDDAADRADPDHPSHHAAATDVAPTQLQADNDATLKLPLPPTIIFCNTVSCCRAVAWFLTEQGLNVGHYHGLMPAHYRTVHFKNFLSGTTSILVATDLASRGLDTTFVQHVVHFDFPLQVLDFIHRVGRTARNGRKGKSTALIGKRDRVLADAIERLSTRGLSIEQLTSDKARYTAEGLPMSAKVEFNHASPTTNFDGPKVLSPSRGAAGSAAAAAAPHKPHSGPLQRGSEPRRRWMRYMTPTQRNQHKLLYSYKEPTPRRGRAQTVGQMRREPERGVKAASTGERAPRSAAEDPFAFTAPPQFRPSQSELHSAARSRAAADREPRQKAPAQPTKFPSSAPAGRRPAVVRPIGPLAHKQRLGAIFAKPPAVAKSTRPIGAPTKQEDREARSFQGNKKDRPFKGQASTRNPMPPRKSNQQPRPRGETGREKERTRNRATSRRDPY